MTAAAEERVTVGQLGAPYGVQGWLRLISYTQPKENIFSYTPWLISPRITNKDQHWETLEFIDARPHGTDFILQLPNCDTPEIAKQQYQGKHIAVYRSQLPKLAENEYYWHDLEGLQVFNEKGIYLGTVDYLFETGVNDVVVVKGEREYLIPYILEQFITKIDLAAKKLYVNWDAEQ